MTLQSIDARTGQPLGPTLSSSSAADIDLAVQWLQARWMPSWNQVGLRVRHRYWHWVLILALFRMGKAVASVVQAF